MKKILCFILCILIIFSIISCGKIENQSRSEETDSNSMILQEPESTLTEEPTTEWANLYANNYRIISKQIIESACIDFTYCGLQVALPAMDYGKKMGYETCIAVATLVDIYETNLNTSSVTLKIEKVLQNNGLEERFVVGNEVSGDSNVKWTKLDDGTYEIEFKISTMPLAEVGYRYIVQLTMYEDTINICAMTLPLDINYCYIDTVATGDEGYWYETNQILWYYDLNETYYLEYWGENAEYANYLKEGYGYDVYDKADVLE